MKLIQPFPGLRPAPNHVATVIAPPYDVLSTQEARQRARNKPYSFLHISKPEIDLPESTDAYAPEVYAKGQQNFLQMITAKVLQQDPQPYYYVYRIIMDQHRQTGLVATASIAAYQQNRIRKHEQTQPKKVTDRVKQINALKAQTGPVLLAYPSRSDIDNLLVEITHNQPEYDVTADDTVQHQLWVIKDSSVIEKITRAFAELPALYIADGHHRSEAAAQIAADQPNNNAHQYFLSAIFPDNQLQIMSYNRVIKDLNGLTVAEFLEKLKKNFQVQNHAEPVQPKKSRQFGMYLAGQWYLLSSHLDKIPRLGLDTLDVSLLANQVLQPILGIIDPRHDSRLDFVGGIRGLQELEKRVNSGEWTVAFSLFPTQMRSIMEVADANQFMPPKSTWFEPKLADGLVSHQL